MKQVPKNLLRNFNWFARPLFKQQKLTQIPIDIIDHTLKMRKLYLNGNQLNVDSFLKEMSLRYTRKMKYVDLSNISFTEYVNYWIENGDRLEMLNLSYN